MVRIPVQWGDQDAFGHVNNTVPHRWFESARIEMFGRIGLLDLTGRAGDRCRSWRRTHATIAARSISPTPCRWAFAWRGLAAAASRFEHAIVSETQSAIVAEGTSTTVVFDYHARKPHPVPDEIRAAIAGQRHA